MIQKLGLTSCSGMIGSRSSLYAVRYINLITFFLAWSIYKMKYFWTKKLRNWRENNFSIFLPRELTKGTKPSLKAKFWTFPTPTALMAFFRQVWGFCRPDNMTRAGWPQPATKCFICPLKTSTLKTWQPKNFQSLHICMNSFVGFMIMIPWIYWANLGFDTIWNCSYFRTPWRPHEWNEESE